MPGKDLIASANWRGEEDVGMDRVLCDGRVVFDQSMKISL